MSFARPDCEVCLSSSLRRANRLLRQGTSMTVVYRQLEQARASAVSHGHTAPDAISYEQIKLHSQVCLAEGRPAYIGGNGVEAPGGGAPIPISVSAAELADPARRMDLLREALAAKIGDLSAKDLYAMYMAELRLQTAQAERDAKANVESPPDVPESDGLDAAMGQAAGHLPDLRVMHGKVASR